MINVVWRGYNRDTVLIWGSKTMIFWKDEPWNHSETAQNIVSVRGIGFSTEWKGGNLRGLPRSVGSNVGTPTWKIGEFLAFGFCLRRNPTSSTSRGTVEFSMKTGLGVCTWNIDLSRHVRHFGIGQTPSNSDRTVVDFTIIGWVLRVVCQDTCKFDDKNPRFL